MPVMQLVGQILERCNLEQLGMLRATCRTFANCEVMEGTARARCKSITRAQGLQPSFRYIFVGNNCF